MTVTAADAKTSSHLMLDGSMTVTVATGADEFDALREDWNTLLEGCDASVYQSFEWQRTWWKYFGEGKEQLYLVVIRRHGRVVGVAPFYIEQSRTLGVLPLRRLAFIGQGPSDYLNVLFAKEEEQACGELLAEHLSAHNAHFDVIHLEDFTNRLTTHQFLFAALQKRGFTGDHFISEYCPRTQLKEDWEKTLASFKIDNRREIRRRARNIHKTFMVEYEVVADDKATAEALDAFIQLHHQKWTSIGHTGEFADERCVRFHHEVAKAFAQRGWLYLAFLRANGERVASLYCFMFRDDFAVYLSGNNTRSDVYKFSPGRVLTAYCMEQAVARGKKVCDFMRGNERYKYELDAKDVPSWAMLLYNPHSLKPELRYRIDLLIKSLKRRTTHERLLYQVVAREHGVFSAKMREHLKARIKKNLVDGATKAKAPERATHIHAKLNDQRSDDGSSQ